MAGCNLQRIVGTVPNAAIVKSGVYTRPQLSGRKGSGNLVRCGGQRSIRVQVGSRSQRRIVEPAHIKAVSLGANVVGSHNGIRVELTFQSEIPLLRIRILFKRIPEKGKLVEWSGWRSIRQRSAGDYQRILEIYRYGCPYGVRTDERL